MFATKGVGPEYFEEMVDLRIAAFRKARQADEVPMIFVLIITLKTQNAHNLHSQLCTSATPPRIQ